MKNIFWQIYIYIYFFKNLIFAHFCGENRIPYGIEIYRNGQPALLCSRPSCFEKTYAVNFIFFNNFLKKSYFLMFSFKNKKK